MPKVSHCNQLCLNAINLPYNFDYAFLCYTLPDSVIFNLLFQNRCTMSGVIVSLIDKDLSLLFYGDFSLSSSDKQFYSFSSYFLLILLLNYSGQNNMELRHLQFLT